MTKGTNSYSNWDQENPLLDSKIVELDAYLVPSAYRNNGPYPVVLLLGIEAIDSVDQEHDLVPIS